MQAANAAPSRLHSKVEGVLALKANAAAVELVGLAGWLLIVVSGGGTIVVLAEAEFAPGPGSEVVEERFAVFESDVVPGLGCTTTVKTALAPDARLLRVQETVPVPPTEGVEHEKAGPLLCPAETKVLPVGTASLSETEAASAGPWLVIVIA
jgi:hypothetical protein